MRLLPQAAWEEVRRFATDRPWMLILLSALFCLRYLSFDFAPFNGDEASLQLAAREALASGEIPWLGLAGTAGMRYGPTGIWFYSVLRWISTNLEFAFFVHTTLHGLGFLLQGIVFQRILKANILLPFLALAWSAPIFWISSRNIWDNSLQVFLFGVLGVLLFPPERASVGKKLTLTPARAIFSGLVAGLLVNLHLMTVPLVGVYFLWAWKAGKLRSREILWVAAVGLLLVLPYLIVAVGAPQPIRSDPKPWIHALHRAMIFPLLLPGLVLSGRVAYFFDQPWEAWAGPLARLWSDFGLSGVLQLVGFGFGVFGLACLPKRARTFVVLALVAYGGFVSVLRLNIQIHPHYWNPVFGLSVLLWALGWNALFERRKRTAMLILSVLLAVNVSAIALIQLKVNAERGFRGAHWGAGVGELGRIAAQYCGSQELRSKYSPRQFALDPRLGFDPSLALEFLISEIPGCGSSVDDPDMRAPLPVGSLAPEAPFSAALTLPSGANSK